MMAKSWPKHSAFLVRTKAGRHGKWRWTVSFYRHGSPVGSRHFGSKEAAERAAANYRSSGTIPSRKRKSGAKKNPILGLPWWAVIGGAALGIYLLTRKKTPATPNVIITKTDTSTVPGSDTFVGPMPQDYDLPPVPDPMSSYNYIRG